MRLPYVVQQDLAYACRRTKCREIVGGSRVLKAVRRLRVAVVNGCPGHTGPAFTNFVLHEAQQTDKVAPNQGTVTIRTDDVEHRGQFSDCKHENKTGVLPPSCAATYGIYIRFMQDVAPDEARNASGFALQTQTSGVRKRK